MVSDGEGTFEATLNDAGDQLSYTLSYSTLNGTVTQAHIHVGQRFVAAGISAFLCSNLSNPPAGTQAYQRTGTDQRDDYRRRCHWTCGPRGGPG